MTSNNDVPGRGGDSSKDFDWKAAEKDLGISADVLSDTHYEAVLDEEPAISGGLVDVPADAEGARPIIPAFLQGWANIKHSARYAAKVAGYHAAFHAVRSPWYGVKAGFWAVVGGFRLLNRVRRWWWVSEGSSVRQTVADEGDAQTWYKLHRDVRATRWTRFLIMAGSTIVAIPAFLVGHIMAPWWVEGLAAAGAIAGLAHIGRPAGRPIITGAVVAGRFRRIDSDIVLRAYYAAGLGHPEKPNQAVHFGSRMSRDAADTGSQVSVDLPYGKTFDDALKARGAIASGLDVSVNQVFITRDQTSHRRHMLFVADRDPLTLPAGRSPLLDCKPRDIWTAAPMGLDERGRKVELLLMWISVLIGAQPRKGKTFATRLLALFAALDPFVRLVVVDGKMSADWDKFRLVAHRYVCGVVPNSRDNDPVTHLLGVLKEIKAHIERVNDFLSKLPTSECPEGKVTRELSRKYEELRVHVLVMEEFQVYYETDSQEINKEIASLLSFIMAVGPSAGVIILSSSQKPSSVGAGDVGRLFNRYRDNHTVRFALKCGNRVVSEAVLGGDAYAEGFDASTLPDGPDYKGIGILYGATDATPITRTFLADHEDAEKILTAARKHREAAGTLSGFAAGEEVVREVRDALADVRGVFVAGEKGLHWPTVAARLAERHPEHYADATAEAVSALLRPHVQSVNVKVSGEVLKGVRIADIDAAMSARKSA